MTRRLRFRFGGSAARRLDSWRRAWLVLGLGARARAVAWPRLGPVPPAPAARAPEARSHPRVDFARRVSVLFGLVEEGDSPCLYLVG